MQLFVRDADEIEWRHALVIDLMPDFPTRSFSSSKIIHHAHSHAIDVRREGNAAITAEPVSQVLQRLKDVVTNFFCIMIRDGAARSPVSDKQRTRIHRVVHIEPAHIWSVNELEYFSVILRTQQRTHQLIKYRKITLFRALPRFNERETNANEVWMRHPEAIEISL